MQSCAPKNNVLHRESSSMVYSNISLGGSGLFGWLGGAFEVGDCYAGVGFEKAAEVALAGEVEAVAIWVTERLVWLSRSFIALTAARSINSLDVIPVPSATIAERYLGDISSSWAKVIA